LDLGRIARPVGKGRYYGPSNAIDQANPWIGIDNVAAYSGTPPAYQGQEVDKIGQGSDWTYGYVTDPCYTTVVFTGSDYGPILYVCQSMVSGGATFGDSGSPVFGPPVGFAGATLYGLAAFASIDGTIFGYSTMYSIYNRLSLNPNGFYFCAC
jgi:hypothetical protein